MPAVHNIQVGAVEKKTIVVTPEVTISRSNERLPSILSTPAMIQFMEMTAGKLIRPHLPDGWISVGVLVNVRHLAATPEGAKVRIQATVTAVRWRTVTSDIFRRFAPPRREATARPAQIPGSSRVRGNAWSIMPSAESMRCWDV